MRTTGCLLVAVALALVGCMQGKLLHEQSEGGETAPSTPVGEARAPTASRMDVNDAADAADAASVSTVPAPDDAAQPTAPTYASGESIQTLATGQSQPYTLAVDGTSVYWAAYGDGTIMKVPIEGGAVTTLVSGLQHPLGLAVNSQGVYFTGNGAPSDTVTRVSFDGGAPGVLGTGLGQGLTLGASTIVGVLSSGGMTSTLSLMTLPIDGGAAQALGAIAGADPSAIAVDATSAYWSCFGQTCPIVKTPLAGGSSTALAAGNVVFGIAVDDTNVYWTEGSGTLKRVPINGGDVVTVASGLEDLSALALDDRSLYVTLGSHGASNAGAIVRVAKDGSAVTYLAQGQNQPADIAVDATSVYWTTVANDAAHLGTVMKATPK